MTESRTHRQPAAGNATRRHYDIDILRVGAVLIGLLYHSFRPFDLEDWHIKNAQVSEWFDLFGLLLTQWRMPLLFLLAGAGTYFALGFRGGGQYAGERVRRLLLPLIVGMLVLIPPQIYVERISAWAVNRTSPIDFAGSYLDFYPLVFTTGVYPDGNLSWHHLWFLAYLFIFSLVALPLFLALRRPAGRRALDRVANALTGRLGIFLLALPLIAVEVILRPRFGDTKALIGDWANLAHYGILFVYGYLLMADDRFGRALERYRRVALVLAVVTTLGRIAWLATGADFAPSSPEFALLRAFRTTTEWFCLVAALGYGRAYLNRPLPGLRWAAEISYPFYIWHQTVIVVIAYFVVQWDAGLAPKFLVLSLTSLLVTVALCELVRRLTLVRPLFGLKTRREPAAPRNLAPRPVAA